MRSELPGAKRCSIFGWSTGLLRGLAGGRSRCSSLTHPDGATLLPPPMNSGTVQTARPGRTVTRVDWFVTPSALLVAVTVRKPSAPVMLPSARRVMAAEACPATVAAIC